MTTQKLVDSYMRHITPTAYWAEGAKRLLDNEVGPAANLRDYAWAVFMTAVGIAFAALFSLALEIVWHPLFYVVPVWVLAIVSWKAGVGAYREAAEIDASLFSFAEQSVREAVMADKNSILHEDGVRRKCEAVLDDKRTSAAPARREMIMRLAAIRAETLTGEDIGVARSAAAAVVERAERMTAGEPRYDGAAAPAADRSAAAGRLAELAGLSAVTDHPSVDALIRLGEEAIAAEPDLTDRAGARVDTLIKRHIPSLVTAYRRALQNADAAEKTVAEEEYRRGLDLAKESLIEALDAAQDRNAQELSNQVRFLDMRRNS